MDEKEKAIRGMVEILIQQNDPDLIKLLNYKYLEYSGRVVFEKILLDMDSQPHY